MPHQRIVVGARLRAARTARGWRQADVAHVVGVSVPFVCDIEAGHRRITARRREAFAQALGLPVSELIELDPTTLAAVESRLRAAGHCEHAIRVVQEMAGSGALASDLKADAVVGLWRGKTPDAILRLIRQRGAMKPGEIFAALREAGRDVSYVTICKACSRHAQSGALRRVKGARYDLGEACALEKAMEGEA